MKRLLLLATAVLFLLGNAGAQPTPRTVPFKNGSYAITGNLELRQLEKEQWNGYTYAIAAFDLLPASNSLQRLRAGGLEVLQVLTDATYLVRFSGTPPAFVLRDAGLRHLGAVPPILKMSSELQAEKNGKPIHAPVSVHLLLHPGTWSPAARTRLQELGFTLSSLQFQNQGLLIGTVPAGSLERLAALPFVRYINRSGLGPQPLMFRERGVFGLTGLTSNQVAGRSLSGEGITVGVGDNADPTSHLDNTFRVINHSPALVSGSTHGTHVTSVVTGDGIIEERWTGTAPASLAIADYFDYVISKTSIYTADYGLTVTNNSYFSGIPECPGNGDYNELSVYIDEQLHSLPLVGHVFAAGNDGLLTCQSYPLSYGTIKSGYQTAKNVLTVGNFDIVNGNIDASSSRGPVADGRLKPEILASGFGVAGTALNNGYTNNAGTSAAAPFVTGIWALLTERYKQLHAGNNPPAALLKTILCNSAWDRGTPGPDYIHGFGLIHPQRAVTLLEQNRFLAATINQGQRFTHILTIPANTRQIKVMLYWTDPAGAPNAPQALQHDLDLQLVDGATTYQPWILNPAQVTAAAVRGVDRRNNIEQVTLDNPGGSLEIQVDGFAIANGPQQFYLTWEFVSEGLTVLHPYGGERFTPISTAPSRLETIAWEATDNSAQPFTLEYSLDNGATWNLIADNIAGNQFRYYWSVPDVVASQAKVRVTRNGGGPSGTTPGHFSIIGANTLTATVPCEGYADLSWTAVPSATDYEVFQLINGTLSIIATTTGLTHRVSGLDRNARYWFAVRPRIAGAPGKRGTARSVVPVLASACNDAFFDNDLKIDTLLSPGNGRRFTSTELGANHPVTVRIRNLDNAATPGSYTVSYQVNNGTIVSEVVTQSISAGSTLDYSFAATANLLAAGEYTLRVWVKQAGDLRTENDEQTFVVRQADNLPLTLPHTETFEATGKDEYRRSRFALQQAERFDFNPSQPNGRLRTYMNQGMALSGNRSVTLDASQFTGVSNTNQLTGTFNLANESATAGLRFDFWFRNHGQLKQPPAFVWMRGSDAHPWLPVYDLQTNQGSPGTTRRAWVNINEVLAAAGQPLTASFQVRFDQTGRTSANNDAYHPNMIDIEDGFSFDDLRISVASNDVELVRIVSPDTLLCQSGPAPVTLRLRNTSGTALTQVPVYYRLNNGTPVEGFVPAIAAGGTVDYSFPAGADLTAPGAYRLDAWVAQPGDSYPVNDSIVGYTVYNSPLISSFPYLEGFETSDGYFFTTQSYASWRWGATNPLGRITLTRAANGANAWFTSLSGGYKPNEESYLYSPCYNLSGFTTPVLSFSHISRQEDNIDVHTVEYSTNNGASWQRLGTQNGGTNWFDNANLTWRTSKQRWHVSSVEIPTNAPSVRFRFLLSTDGANQREGIGIDDIHIFEKETIYSGSDATGLSQPVNGTGFVHFRSGGQLVASINPLGQNLGTTTVDAYLHSGPTRFLNNQYYLNRNLVIRSSQPLTDSVLVRFYFTEADAAALLDATNCGSCLKFRDAFLAAVTKYSGPEAFENGILNDGTGGTYEFLDSGKVAVMPFNNGYYAEFKVRSFSEFWIHAVNFNLNQEPTSVRDPVRTANFIRNVFIDGANQLQIVAGSSARVQDMYIRVLNSNGQCVMEDRRSYRNSSLPANSWAPGMYIVEIRNTSGTERFVQKVMKL
ncbi:MAG TPA: S8 family serine peptidase [Lacibacter sp.]|nr:S8 family serine peptidase [Lacibacter sp.]HMO88046.1 S8 family serine peptidase [Lacibacter sp.]